MTDPLISFRRALFCVSAPLFFINFSIPVQAKRLGASAIEIGALFSLLTFCLLLLRPLVGVGLDKFGRRPFLLAALIMYVVSNLAYAVAGDIGAMYLARLCQGIGASLLIITVDAITTDLTDSHVRAVEMGRNIEVQTRASIVGAFVGFSLVSAMPANVWMLAFGTFALLAGTGFLIALTRVPESHLPAPVTETSSSLTMNARLARLLGIVFVAGFANALIQPIYLIYLQDHFDVPMERLPVAFLPAAIIFMVAPSRLAVFTARWGAENCLVAGLLLAGSLYLVFPQCTGFWAIVGIYTLAALGWALADPARKSLTAAHAGEGNTGRTFGTVELLAGLGGTAGPLVGGYLYDFQGQALTFYVTGAVLIIAAIFYKLLAKILYKYT
jgi:MFS family permease